MRKYTVLVPNEPNIEGITLLELSLLAQKQSFTSEEFDEIASLKRGEFVIIAGVFVGHR
jgi:hypothetical protein